MRMVEPGPHGKILDRDLSLAITSDVRRVAGASLQAVVDEGIAVFERCSVTARGADEQIGILFPYLNTIELLDGVDIALAGASVVAAQIGLRAVFEGLLAVEYVLQDNTQQRAAAYVVAEIHKRIAAVDRYDATTQRGKQFAATIAKDMHGAEIQIPVSADSEEKRSGYRELLAAPHLITAADEYERTRKAMRKVPPFYSLWSGPRDLEQLANAVRRAGQYDVMYRQWSSIAHGTDLSRQLRSADGEPAVSRFRSGESMNATYMTAITLGLNAITAIVTHYRPAELPTLFGRWYRQAVRPGYLALGMGEPPSAPA